MAQSPRHRRLAVIMAGGSGERFWPLSRQGRPKQLLRLASDKRSMLAEAVSRIGPVIPAQDVYVVTGAHLVDPIREAQVGVPPENVLAEPCKKNTSGCLAYATAWFLSRFGEAAEISMAVLTADHAVGDGALFCKTVETALRVAEEQGALVTLGVAPTRPETGYGYIQIPEDRSALPGYAAGPVVYRVERFHEKPDQCHAEEFVASGRYLWNAGMFFWTVAAFLEELDAVRPALGEAVRAMTRALRAGRLGAVRAIFEQLPDISIDCALMEQARKVAVVRADFAWDDVGAWPALDRTSPHDDRGNVVVGDPVLVDSENCIVYCEPDQDGRDITVAVLGERDQVVVVTPDAILVAPKHRAQDVRKVVAELKRRGAKPI